MNCDESQTSIHSHTKQLPVFNTHNILLFHCGLKTFAQLTITKSKVKKTLAELTVVGDGKHGKATTTKSYTGIIDLYHQQ